MKNFKKFVKSFFANAFILPFFCVAIISSFLFIFENRNIIVFSSSLNTNFYNNILKEDNKLNPDYIEYLSLTEKEKENVIVVPRQYEINIESLYSFNTYTSSSIPEEYSLYYTSNICKNFTTNNKSNFANLPKNIGDQKKTGLCWSFATLNSFESFLYKTGKVSTSENLNFSELHLAYVSQCINHNMSCIGGGNFELAYEYLAFEKGPCNEQNNEKSIFSSQVNTADQDTMNSYLTTYYQNASSFLSNYCAMETYSYPSRSSCTTLQQKTDLRNSIKNHIMSYGSVTASIYYLNSYLSYSTNPYTYIFTGSSSTNANHLITLVGWDDNYTYGNHTGAYIAQNSWGSSWSDGGFFYIMYDDTLIEDCVDGFVRIDEKLENFIEYNSLKDTDNEDNFLGVTNGNTFYYSLNYGSYNLYFANIFEVDNSVNNQYISRIKIPTIMGGNNGQCNFNIYILDDIDENEINTKSAIINTLTSKFDDFVQVENNDNLDTSQPFISCQTGMYTIELEQEIIVDGQYFIVLVEMLHEDSVYFLDNGNNANFESNDMTFCSTNKTSWDYYSFGSDKCILPIVVETQYSFSTFSNYYANDITQTYSGQNVNFDVNVDDNVNYTVSYSLTGGNDWNTNLCIKDVGSYKVYYKITANYYQTIVGDDVFFNVTINKKDLFVTPYENQCKTYGESSNVIIDTEKTGFFETPSYTGAVGREDGENVGFYNIIKNTFNIVDNNKTGFKANNYNLVFVTGIKYEIKKKTITVTPQNDTKVYGEQDSNVFLYNYSETAFNEIPGFDGFITRENGENVDSYKFLKNTLSLTNLDNFNASNYTLVFDDTKTNFVITKKDIIILPNDFQKKNYGDADTILTFTYSGVVGNEEISFVEYTNLIRASGETVGSYIISLGTLALKDNILDAGRTFLASNYNIVLSQTHVYFRIVNATLDGCSFDNKSLNYDGQEHCLEATNSNIKGDIILISYSTDNQNWSSNTINYKNAGQYIVYAKFENENYNTVVMQAQLTIRTLDLNVFPVKNQSKIYDGTELCSIQYDYDDEDLVSGEIPSFSGSLVKESGCDVGSYLISKGEDFALCNNGKFLTNNYNLIFINTELVCFDITKRNITIVPESNQSKIYNTVEPQSFNYFITNLVDGENPASEGSLSRQSGERVGSYIISQGSLVLKTSNNLLENKFNINNYNVSFSSIDVYFNIVKAKIVLTVQDVSSYYDGENYIDSFSYLIDNIEEDGLFKQGDVLGIEFSCAVNANTKEGEYEIKASLVNSTLENQNDNDNYDIKIVNGKYTVLYKSYNVNFDILGEITTLNKKIKHFSKIDLSDIPNCSVLGYEFNFWKIIYENNSYEQVNFSNYQIVSDVTFVADMKLIYYYVNFNTKCFNIENYNLTYTISSKTFDLEPISRKGYSFLGWFDKDYNNQITSINKGSFGDINVYAKWQINQYNINIPNETEKYSLIYSGELKRSYNAYFEFEIILNEAYTQSKDMLILKYNSTEDETLKEIELKDGKYKISNIFGDIQIFIEGIEKNTYKINFYAGDDKIDTIIKEYGQNLNSSEFPDIPEKENYNQSNPQWNKENIENITEDTNLYAVYTPNEYNITFIMQDGKTLTTTVTYGQSIDLSFLNEEYDLSVFEHFEFDKNINCIDDDMTINVEIKSKIYILYIALASLGGIIFITFIALAIRKHRRNKFNWWAYTNIKK